LYLKDRVRERMAGKAPEGVWTPPDFLDLAPREAVDKALQRLAAAGDIRRIDRGVYDMPKLNALTGKSTVPDYRKVIDAVARRDHLRILVDPLTAAYQLGWTTAVPARAVVHTDRRLKPVKLGNLTIEFRVASPTRLYWAGRPAMLLIQALHWIRDMLSGEQATIEARIRTILADPVHGPAIRSDLKEGWSALPAWLQDLLRPILQGGGAPWETPRHEP
jgi:hypothetical protein